MSITINLRELTDEEVTSFIENTDLDTYGLFDEEDNLIAAANGTQGRENLTWLREMVKG